MSNIFRFPLSVNGSILNTESTPSGIGRKSWPIPHSAVTWSVTVAAAAWVAVVVEQVKVTKVPDPAVLAVYVIFS